MADSKKSEEFFTYKGRPLVRCGDEMYYGNMEEPYVIRLQIKRYYPDRFKKHQRF